MCSRVRPILVLLFVLEQERNAEAKSKKREKTEKNGEEEESLYRIQSARSENRNEYLLVVMYFEHR